MLFVYMSKFLCLCHILQFKITKFKIQAVGLCFLFVIVVSVSREDEHYNFCVWCIFQCVHRQKLFKKAFSSS